jgi:hypothetical protein
MTPTGDASGRLLMPQTARLIATVIARLERLRERLPVAVFDVIWRSLAVGRSFQLVAYLSSPADWSSSGAIATR